MWWDVSKEGVGRKCGGMFGWKVLVESVVGCLEGRCCRKYIWRDESVIGCLKGKRW